MRVFADVGRAGWLIFAVAHQKIHTAVLVECPLSLGKCKTMEEYAVDILPGELLGWVRADAKRKTPRLWVRVSKDYWVDTDHGRELANLGEEDIAPLVVRGVMEISPQGERQGWTLQVSAEDSVGLRPVSEDERYENESDMTVEAFVSEFLIPEHGEVEIVVLAEDAMVWRRFQRWLARRRAAHV